ncbi:MAG: sporulation peptidase YabG, partial [bacterium]|nr:sporulation peptidase YabG [bacterium]
MFQVGDLVTRKSYDNDIVFKIIKIEENNFILKGLFVRLFADSPKDDLKIYND